MLAAARLGSGARETAMACGLEPAVVRAYVVGPVPPGDVPAVQAVVARLEAWIALLWLNASVGRGRAHGARVGEVWGYVDRIGDARPFDR